MGRCEERDRILNEKSKLERIGKGKETEVSTFLIKQHCNSSSMDLFYFFGLYDHACNCAKYTASNDRVATECKRMWEEVAMA
jgi:hypothetical protein